MKRAGMVLAVAMLWASAVRAQSTLPLAAKVELTKAAVQAAAEQAGKNELDKAKFCLLGVTDLFIKVQAALPADTQQQFTALVARLWPDPVTDANAVQVLQAFKATITASRPNLTRFVLDLDFFTPKDNLSFEQWAQYVIKAKATYPQAEACAVEYCRTAPSPAVHVSQPGVQLGGYEMLNYLCKLLFAEAFADQRLQNDILPRSLKKCEEKAAEAKPDITNAATLLRIADDLRELAGFALVADQENATAKGFVTQADAIVARAEKLYAAQVADNRFPPAAYQGRDAAELQPKLEAAYRKAYPNETLVKLHITGDNWVERAEAWSEGDVIKSGVFRTVGAAVAVKRADGRHWVFRVVFGREWTGRGDEFGEPYLVRTTGNYEILPEQVK